MSLPTDHSGCWPIQKAQKGILTHDEAMRVLEEEERLQAIVESLPDGALMLDGKFTIYNGLGEHIDPHEIWDGDTIVRGRD